MSGAAQEVVVTEEDLLKSLRKLEGVADEPAAGTKVVKIVRAEQLMKSLSDRLEEEGSEVLKKSLDVSTPLAEFADLVGIHVDTSLTALQKSLEAAANRDMSVIAVIEKLAKSIETLTAKVEEYGAQPNGKPRSTGGDSTKTEPLEKGLKGGDGTPKPEDASKVKRQVLEGLEILAKSHAAGTPESQRWTTAAIKFETANAISDSDLNRALAAVRRSQA
jgi:hypothetical protein